MKTLHLSIITVTGIGVIVVAAFLLFFMAPYSGNTQNPDTPASQINASAIGLSVDGLENTYLVGQQINFNITTTSPECSRPNVTLIGENGSIVWINKRADMFCDMRMSWPAMEHWGLDDGDLGVLQVNNTGTYKITISFLGKTLEKEFSIVSEPENASTTTTQYTSGKIITSCASHIENQTIFAGGAGTVLCQISSFSMSSEIINYTGFLSVNGQINSSSLIGNNTYIGVLQKSFDMDGNKRAEGNFVLEPGHNATITYAITGAKKCVGICPTKDNVTNDAVIYHHENNHLAYSHSGITVSYYPKSEIVTNNQTVIVKATIMASNNADRGTYWVILAPGNCVGGPLILLTVSDCEQQK